MAINVFEGARRISLLCASLAVIGTVIWSFTYEPYISVTYSIDLSNDEIDPSKVIWDDPTQEELEKLYEAGTPINPTHKDATTKLDLSTAKPVESIDTITTGDFDPDAYIAKYNKSGLTSKKQNKNSQPLIQKQNSCPSNTDSHYFTTKLSTEEKVSVTLCFGETAGSEEALENNFKIPVEDEKEIRKEFSEKYRKELLEGFGYLLAGLLLFGGVIWAIGWIVRGFLGIPRGMDKRQN